MKLPPISIVNLRSGLFLIQKMRKIFNFSLGQKHNAKQMLQCASTHQQILSYYFLNILEVLLIHSVKGFRF